MVAAVKEAQLVRDRPRDLYLPPALLARLAEFILDRRTGNVRLNIRDGVILGFDVEERVSVRAKP